MTSRSEIGSRPGSIVAMSITCTSAAQRSTWRRKSWPSPRPSLAPSIRPGDVGDGERGVAGGHHTEVGHQRRERVVGDLRPGPRQRRDQAGLAGAREADQADVGDHLELEDHAEVVAGLAEQREAGGLALGRGQRRVAEAATAALPRPPSRCPGPTRSASTAPWSSRTTVPSGTESTRSPPCAPLRLPPAPWPPCGGLAVRAVVVVDQRGDVGVDAQDRCCRPDRRCRRRDRRAA